MMTRKHFEWMAATIANETQPKSMSRDVMVDFAINLAGQFNSDFDLGRFYSRIEQYDSGERNPVTYLNSR